MLMPFFISVCILHLLPVIALKSPLYAFYCKTFVLIFMYLALDLLSSLNLKMHLYKF